MIVSVTLNPCIDKTIYLEQLDVGEYNRVQNTRTDVCGKGVNVSAVLSHLQMKTCCTGFNFRENGQLLEQALEREGIPHDFILADGAIRTNIKLFDSSRQMMTEINESGQEVSAQAADALLKKIEGFLDKAELFVLSGSIPPGVPKDIYKTIIQMAHRNGIKTILDAAGELFLHGLAAKPYLIKPNTFEFEQVFQKEIREGMSILEIARGIIQGGIPYVCISMGEKGALLIDKDHAYQAKALPVEVRGLTGAGDSMVAGMCYAISHQMGAREMLRYAVAAAGASVRLEGTLLASLAGVEELLPLVEIVEL